MNCQSDLFLMPKFFSIKCGEYDLSLTLVSRILSRRILDNSFAYSWEKSCKCWVLLNLDYVLLVLFLFLRLHKASSKIEIKHI